MQLTPYTQGIIDKVVQHFKSGDPITLVSMYDTGLDFWYAATVENIKKTPSPFTPVFLDLSATSDSAQQLFELKSSLAEATHQDFSASSNHSELLTQLLDLTQQQQLAFVIYMGYQSILFDQSLMRLFSQLRHHSRFSCTYVTLTNVRFMLPILTQPANDQNYYFQQVTGVIVPLVPENLESSLALTKIQAARYSIDFTDQQKQAVYEFSGGLSGLNKTLSLQILDNPNWQEPNLDDPRLETQILGILNDLPTRYLTELFSDQPNRDSHEVKFLVKFGYLTSAEQAKPFTPLLKSYFPKIKSRPDQIATQSQVLILTASQRVLLSLFKSRLGEIISRDLIAETIWGEAWEVKYSDWAIDQQISTLRDKLELIEPTSKIVTKKGEGYVFLT